MPIGRASPSVVAATFPDPSVAFRPVLFRPVLLEERDEPSMQEQDQLTSSEYPLVSVIVVAEAVVSTHQACVDTVLSDTDYPNYELLVLDDETDAERTAWLGSLRTRIIASERFRSMPEAAAALGSTRGSPQPRARLLSFLTTTRSSRPNG